MWCKFKGEVQISKKLNLKYYTMKRLLLLLSVALLSNSYVKAQNDSIGVYYETNNGLEKISPIRYTKTKTNTLGAAFSMGIASSSIKKVYPEKTSRNVVNESPIFYFYYQKEVPFNQKTKYYMFYASDTPEDIILAKFKPKKKTRELSVGKVNAYSGFTMGTADDIDVNVEYEEIREGVFRVKFDRPIANGEYCFLLNEPDGVGAYMYVFDFTINGLIPW